MNYFKFVTYFLISFLYVQFVLADNIKLSKCDSCIQKYRICRYKIAEAEKQTDLNGHATAGIAASDTAKHDVEYQQSTASDNDAITRRIPVSSGQVDNGNKSARSGKKLTSHLDLTVADCEKTYQKCISDGKCVK